VRVAAVERDRGARAWFTALLASSSVLVLAAWLAPAVVMPPVVAYAVAFCVVCASALGAAFTAPLWAWSRVAACALVGASCVLIVSVSAANAWAAALLSCGLLSCATVLGAALGARIERPGHLAAVALVSSIADVWSVFDPAAPSARLAVSIEAAGPGVLSPWVLPWPMLGSALIEPVLGVGDVVFMALYAAAARAHGLAVWRMWLALSLGCVVALGLVVTLARPLPLLPTFAVAVLALEPAARRLESREWRALALFVACAVAALLVRSL